ncbi:MAG: TRAP transporter small permease subunit [Martelella sp.]|uniref:TRAP transporter small permease subunit n=1 Tax=Martelella sp. TaxID=1969699 RepID=UPI003241F820
MTQSSRFGDVLVRVGQALINLSAWPGRAAAWLLLPLTLLVLATIIGSLLQLGAIVQWGVDIPILGRGLTINSLNEMQWHLLAVLTMLALPYALACDRHVRVDMISSGFSPRRRALVELIGDLLLLLPFCIVIGYLSINFAAFAYRTGEQSTYGGLTDRWVVKSSLSFGLAILALTGVGRVLKHVGVLIGGVDAAELRHD